MAFLDDLEKAVKTNIANDIIERDETLPPITRALESSIENLDIYAGKIREYVKKICNLQDVVEYINSEKLPLAVSTISKILKEKDCYYKDINLRDKVKLLEGLKKSINTYEKAIRLLRTLIDTELKHNKKSSKERYEKEHNIYSSHYYIEYPLSVLGFGGYKDMTAFMVLYSDYASLEGNKKWTYKQLRNNDILLDAFVEAFNIDKDLFKSLDDEGRLNMIEQIYDKDLYFEQFNNMNSDEKVKVIQEDIEITHIMIQDSQSTESAVFMLKGGGSNKGSKVVYKDLTDNPDRFFEEYRKYYLCPATV